MIRRFALVFLLIPVLFVSLTGTPSRADDSKQVTEETPLSGPLAGKTVYSHSFALLIGINKYENLPPRCRLQFAVADATALRDVLVKSYGFPPENITLLTDSEATLKNIQAALTGYNDSGKVGKDDRLLVFFSGHGQTVSTPLGGDRGFLVPVDANVDISNPSNIGPYDQSCISMNWLKDTLEDCPAKHVLVLVDACYSGLLTQSRGLQDDAPTPGVVAEDMEQPARQVITAGTKGQVSVEKANLGHGLFTYKLLDQLNARASVGGTVFTATDLYESLHNSVANETNGAQVPQLGSFDTDGDFL
ncbi:MAG: caspase domain-containing protein, partial [Capsulimonadaceae bacterium]